MNLVTILQSLRDQPRRLGDDENLYIHQLGEELARAASDAERWRIMEREGLSRLDGFKFTDGVLAKLYAIRRAAMH